MIRLPLFALSALAAALLFSAPAQACEGHAKKPATKTEARADESKAATPGVTASEAVDSAIAGKCACGSQADCTCKKNDCQCSKCSKKRKTAPLYESLKGARSTPNLENARYDASAGVFI